MTNIFITTTSLSSLASQEAKEKRRQVLARAAQVRKANYARFMQRKRAFHNRDGQQGEI